MNKLLEKQGDLQEQIDALGLWELDHKIDIAMDALRLPPGRRRRHDALGRRAAPGGALPPPARAAGHAAARRADQPPRRRERRVAGAATSREFPGTVVAVTHDRYFLDNVAGGSSSWTGRGHSLGGQLLLAGWSRRRSGSPRRRSRPRPGRGPWSASSSGSGCRPGAAGQEQGAHQRATRSCGRRRERQTRGQRRDPHPGPRAAGRRGRGRDERRQGLRRPAALREPQLLAAAGRHRGRHRPQRRRQDHAVPDDHRPGDSPTAARSRSARRCRSPTWTRAATRSTPRRRSTRRSPAARTSSSSASAR